MWIPKTRTWVNKKSDDYIVENGKTYFLEGGIMKFPKNSPFLYRVLETFPEYNEEAAKCWACVGPTHLTKTYIDLQKLNTVNTVPSLIDSEQVNCMLFLLRV